jgi:hypothetical protein
MVHQGRRMGKRDKKGEMDKKKRGQDPSNKWMDEFFPNLQVPTGYIVFLLELTEGGNREIFTESIIMRMRMTREESVPEINGDLNQETGDVYQDEPVRRWEYTINCRHELRMEPFFFLIFLFERILFKRRRK